MAVVDVELALLVELDSDSTAANRSCINCPSACAGFWVELVDEVELLEVELLELPDVLDEPSCGGGGAIEIPISLSDFLMACIN